MGIGENLIMLTQSVWLFFSVVNLQSPRVLKSLTSFSAPEEIIYLLSGEKATVNTSLLCPTNLFSQTPFCRSQSLSSLSQLLEIKCLLSLVIARSEIKWLWPLSIFFGFPTRSSLDSSKMFQMRIDLSLELEITIGVETGPSV